MITHLYTFSSIIQEINLSIASDTASIRSIASIIERDPSISALVLRFANSSYYGLSQKVTSIAMALTILGLHTVKGLINTAWVLKIFANARFGVIEPVSLWLHSLGCAIASRALVKAENLKLQEETFICGLLHDIGTLVLLENESAKMEQIHSMVNNEPYHPQGEAEMDVLGLTHASLGADLARHWHLPEAMVEAIRCHHDPEMFLDHTSPESRKNAPHVIVAAAVHAGNAISKSLGLGTAFDERASEIHPDVWAVLGVKIQDIEYLMTAARHEFCEIRESIDFQ